MSLVPNHHERQFMQQLRDRGWVNAVELPDSRITLLRLLEKHWIESRETGRGLAYRITEEGMAAKKAPIHL
jgi:hypothetical protein